MPTRASTLQIVITDAARREYLRAFVGRVVTLHGSASEQLKAHHYTALLFAFTAFEPPTDGTGGALTGGRGAVSRALFRALTAGGIATGRCLTFQQAAATALVRLPFGR
jgi:hypothetical protein